LDTSLPLTRWAFALLVLLGAIDRSVLLSEFGFRYTSDDDSIIWLAARDYSQGVFHEPYFYGQDYNPLLEALVGAPLLKVGIPVWIAIPIVTSLLALLPFWSFGLWHQRRGQYFMASLFAALPLLLPIEYGMITTIARGIVTGIAVLALYPWCSRITSPWWKALITGSVLAGAGFFNPNAMVFCVAAGVVLVLQSERRIVTTGLALLGSIPWVLLFWAARAWYAARPERVVHTLYDWQTDFYAVGIPEGLGELDRSFAWLFPVLWKWGELAFWALPLLVVLFIRKRQWAMAIGVLTSVLLILYSMGLAKVHDGLFSAFFPASRMFLAVPLLSAWAIASVVPEPHKWDRSVPLVLLICTLCLGLKIQRTPTVLAEQLADRSGPVLEMSLADLRRDMDRLVHICQKENVGIVVAVHQRKPIDSTLRCYLYEQLDPRMPPAYLYKRDRRYWQRAELSARVAANVLVIGGDTVVWRTRMATDPSIMNVSDSSSGTLHVVHGNVLPTDSLVVRLLGQPNM
jgi:hypothetical protein